MTSTCNNSSPNGNVMIDFETLSTHKDAAVFALCVTRFTGTRIVEEKLFKIPLGDQIRSHKCPDTIRFWAEMPELYLDLTFPRGMEPELLPVISEILEFIGERNIWCNWVKSDGNWLDNLVSYLHVEVNFRQYRCYATMLNTWPDFFELDNGENYIPHNPVHDCRKQVHRLQQLNEHLCEFNMEFL